ncbi:MAG: exopolyphosphatase [Fibrobacterota bacterium]
MQVPNTNPSPFAVIDIGTNAVRMDIAQMDDKSGFRKLESAQQAVMLGKDTFTRGTIENANLTECINALNSFRRVLDEYAVDMAERVRVVATSAVREAGNRDIFLDRVETATGFRVQVLEEAEVNRYAYLSVQPFFAKGRLAGRNPTLLLEVGAGSTELLIFRQGRVAFSYSYRLGSLRMRGMLEGIGATSDQFREYVANQTQRIIEHFRRQFPDEKSVPQLLAAGGDIRFAASLIKKDRAIGDPDKIPIGALGRLADQFIGLSADDIVRDTHLPYGEAELLGPALLVYAGVAKSLGAKHVLVTSRTMRDGIFMEMAAGNAWSPAYRQQIVYSALEIGGKYHFDSRHAQQVASFTDSLFDTLQERHRLSARYKLILNVAALLHDSGLFVSNRNHHKHSLYLILNSDLFGLGSRHILLAALVARYHRRALPEPDHEGYRDLPREERLAVSKMAALLRIADALDRRQEQHLSRAVFAVDNDTLNIGIRRVSDIGVEQMALKKKSDLFEQIFGMRATLTRTTD